MLAFIFTDFAIDKDMLDPLQKELLTKASIEYPLTVIHRLLTQFLSAQPIRKSKITMKERLKALDKFYSELQKAMVDLAKNCLGWGRCKKIY